MQQSGQIALNNVSDKAQMAAQKVKETVGQAKKYTFSIFNDLSNDLSEGAMIAGEELRAGIYNLADSQLMATARKNINIAGQVAINSSIANLASWWEKVKCFLRFGCKTKNTAGKYQCYQCQCYFKCQYSNK